MRAEGPRHSFGIDETGLQPFGFVSHPYPDGNGRIGRFILNALLASGGYPWTVIRVEHRKAYMDALEKASARHDIADFARFVATEMAASVKLKD